MNERDPYRDPVRDDPTLPPRNPNLGQPGVDPYPADRTTVVKQRNSSNGIWFAAAAVVLIALAAFFLMGQPSGTGDVPATGSIPQSEQPATSPIEPASPSGGPVLDAPPTGLPPAGSPPPGGQPN